MPSDDDPAGAYRSRTDHDGAPAGAPASAVAAPRSTEPLLVRRHDRPPRRGLDAPRRLWPPGQLIDYRVR